MWNTGNSKKHETHSPPQIDSMPNIKANNINIEYDTFGNRYSPPLLLIMGLSGQMILWDDEFCNMLAEKDLFVIRFDNRDVGYSSKIKETDDSELRKLFLNVLSGIPITPPYTLNDMADDAIGLLDCLEIKQAHIAGTSMGGMIAQIMATHYPERVLSLTSISSTTGNPELIQKNHAMPEAPTSLYISIPKKREENIAFTVKGMKELTGPGFPIDESYLRKMATLSYDRCFYPEGAERQLLAVLVSENRKSKLAELTIPTLVIHGDSDPLVPLEGGRDTASAVKGSELMVIEGMGHDLPKRIWPSIVTAISNHTKK